VTNINALDVEKLKTAMGKRLFKRSQHLSITYVGKIKLSFAAMLVNPCPTNP